MRVGPSPGSNSDLYTLSAFAHANIAWEGAIGEWREGERTVPPGQGFGQSQENAEPPLSKDSSEGLPPKVFLMASAQRWRSRSSGKMACSGWLIRHQGEEGSEAVAVGGAGVELEASG